MIFSYLNFFVNRLVLPFSSVTSIIGFMLLLSILMQLLSGFFLAWYYIPEPGLVVELREEMFNDTRFGGEVFYMHVRGVDTLMVLSYMHILKKIYLKKHIKNRCRNDFNIRPQLEREKTSKKLLTWAPSWVQERLKSCKKSLRK